MRGECPAASFYSFRIHPNSREKTRPSGRGAHMGACQIVNKPRNFIRQRKLDIISGIIGEANLALQNPERTRREFF